MSGNQATPSPSDGSPFSTRFALALLYVCIPIAGMGLFLTPLFFIPGGWKAIYLMAALVVGIALIIARATGEQDEGGW